jgi:hypothetical protein
LIFMELFYAFLVRNDVWIYILCAFGLFWYSTELWRARQILRRAAFGLEREQGSRMRNNALVFMLLLGSIVGGLVYVNVYVAPTLRPELLSPATPTPDIFATPLSSPTPLYTAVPPTPTGVLAPTVTLPGQLALPTQEGEEAVVTATETAVPNATATPFVGCRINLNIIEPGEGSVVSGVVTFSGTAEAPDFGYYTLEANGPQTNGQWASLLGRTIEQPVNNSFLGSANLSEWASGPYLIRLTAVSQQGNTIGTCVIQVTIAN